MSADAYPASAPQQPHNDSRHVAQNMSLVYPNLSRPTFSEKDPDRSDFGLSVEDSEIEDEDVDEIDAYGTVKDELFDAPRCTGVIEWFNCLFFDVILLLLETALAIWLARSLYPHEMITEYRSILVLLAVPALINPFIWLRMKLSGSSSHYKRIGTLFIFVLLLSSLNSPFFVYVWHLYQSALGSRRSALNSKMLANTFRMVQATFTSVPLLVLNVATLASVLRAEDDDNVIDIRLLSAHLGEVKMHGLAFFVSMLNLLRAASLFNERLTFTVMFGIIALPFLILTVISRLMSVAIVVAFLDFQWTAVMFAALFFCNVLFYAMCRKRSKVVSKDSILQPVGRGTSTATSNTHSSSTTEDDLIETAESYSEDSSQGCFAGMCCSSPSSGKRCCQDKGVKGANHASLNTSHRSGKYNIATGTYYTTSRTKQKASLSKQNTTPETCWSDLPKFLALSIGSILVPVGYANDVRQHHPRIKGGLFLLVNYVSHMLIIGLALGYTIRHKVPNTIKGVSISNPSIEVQIPDSKVFIGAAGMDVALNMPKTKMNLGSMPAMTATLNTEASDVMHAIILPVVFAVFCLPFVIMRAAMMELDCFITHKKELDSLEDVKLANSKHRRKLKNRNSDSLLETVLRNSENKTLKTRMYVSLCCGVFGMMIFTTFTMMAGAFIFFSLH